MNLTRTMTDLGNLYNEKVNLPNGTFKTQTDKKVKQAEADKKAFVSSPSGPAEADNFQKETVDPKTAKDDNYYEPKKFSQNCEKTETETINNFMNKSIFDKLYEDVMSDRMDDVETNDMEALGLPSGDETSVDSDEVTMTLDRATAEKLCDVLKSVLGSEEEVDEMDMESEVDEVDSEDNESPFGEATDIQELKGNTESLQGKNNKVGDVTSSLASKGDGEGAVTDEVGNTDTGKHPLVQDTDMGNLKGKNNKVASKTSKVGAYLAGLK